MMCLLAKARRAQGLLAIVAVLSVLWPVLSYVNMGFTGRGEASVPLVDLWGTAAGLLVGAIPAPAHPDAERLTGRVFAGRVVLLAGITLAIGGVLVAGGTWLSLHAGTAANQMTVLQMVRSFVFFAGLGYISGALFGKGSAWVLPMLTLGWMLYFGYSYDGRVVDWNVIDAADCARQAWACAAGACVGGLGAVWWRPSRFLFSR